MNKCMDFEINDGARKTDKYLFSSTNIYNCTT